MFSDRFEELCREKGVKPGRACVEMGASRSLYAKWRTTKTEKPSADMLEKMSAYFGKSIEAILCAEKEKAPAPEGEHRIVDKDIMFAFWGDSPEMDKEDLEDVRRYAEFVKARKKAQNN